MHHRKLRSNSNYEDAYQKLALLDSFRGFSPLPTMQKRIITASSQDESPAPLRLPKVQKQPMPMPTPMPTPPPIREQITPQSYVLHAPPEPLSEVQSALELQNIRLKKLIKEHKDRGRQQQFREELNDLKSHLVRMVRRIPKVQPEFDEIREELTQLRKQQYMAQMQQMQQLQQIQQAAYFQQSYNPYGFVQYQQPPQNKVTPKSPKSAKTTKQQSRVSQSKQISFPLIQKPTQNDDDDALSQRSFKVSRLKVIFLTVLAAMRWMLQSRPINRLWKQLSQHLIECKQQIQKLTQEVVLQRINNWCLMVLAKVGNYLETAKDLNCIDTPLNDKDLDISFMQITTALKYVTNSLITYSTKDFVIPELKLLCYVQFFDQPEIDRGVFVGRRVLFWREKQLDMTKTQQMMIIGELVLLVHVIPTLLSMKGPPYLIKSVATLLQIHYMKYFDLRVLTRQPQYHLVQLMVQQDGDKFIQILKDVEDTSEERYIVGLYEESDFQIYQSRRVNFEEEMSKSMGQIHQNLIKTLMSK